MIDEEIAIEENIDDYKRIKMREVNILCDEITCQVLAANKSVTPGQEARYQINQQMVMTYRAGNSTSAIDESLAMQANEIGMNIEQFVEYVIGEINKAVLINGYIESFRKKAEKIIDKHSTKEKINKKLDSLKIKGMAKLHEIYG